MRRQEGETPIFFAASKAGRTEELASLEKQTDDAADTASGDSNLETKAISEDPTQPNASPEKKEGDSSPSQDGNDGEALAESPEELAWRAKEDILDLLTTHGADANIANKEVQTICFAF